MTRGPIDLLPLFRLALASLLPPGTARTALADDNGSGKQKVVYHVNNYGLKEQTAALRNVPMDAPYERSWSHVGLQSCAIRRRKKISLDHPTCTWSLG